jgi:16S rRNA processing protein RimM
MTPGSSPNSSLFCAAVIASAHGVHGHVKVKCFLEDPQQLKAFSPFCNEKGEEAYKIGKVISQDHDVLTLSLEGVTDRTQAETLKGAKFLLSQERLPELSEDTFYHKDLIGLPVKSSKGQLLGEVRAIYNFGAGELLEVKTLQGRVEMIPFTKEIVSEVAKEEGFILLSQEGEAFLRGEVYVS